MAGRTERSSPLAFSCSCGTVHGHLAAEGASSGTHILCHCPDCRAAHLHFNQPDPAPDGVDLFQTTPDMITFDGGQDQLGLFRLSPRGLMRWYATCCNTPLFNTTTSVKMSFVGIVTDSIADRDRLGPVVAEAHVPQQGGKPKHKGAGRMVWGIFSRMAANGMSGRWRQTPFFDDAGQPVAQAVVPSKEERSALYKPSQRRTRG